MEEIMTIAGYRYHDDTLPSAPLTIEELALMKEATLLDESL